MTRKVTAEFRSFAEEDSILEEKIEEIAGGMDEVKDKLRSFAKGGNLPPNILDMFVQSIQ